MKLALEQAGCIVWYDRERLKPGMYWPDELEQEISRRCSLFVSMISRTTEQTAEAYFHRERAWAATRASGFSPAEEFYVPVIIDDSPFEFTREPNIARDRQAFRALGGNPPPDCPEYLREVQRRRLKILQSAS